MKRCVVVLTILSSFHLLACGGASPPRIMTKQTPQKLEEPKDQKILKALDRETHLQASPARCVASSVAELYGTAGRYPTTADWLQIQGCCGPTPIPQKLACKQGALSELTSWFRSLPTDMQTGNIGLAAYRSDVSTLCSVRLSAPMIEAVVKGNNRYRLSGNLEGTRRFLRLLKADGTVLDRPMPPVQQRQLTLEVSPNLTTLEILHAESGREKPNLFAGFGQKQTCNFASSEAEHPKLTPATILANVNQYRVARGLSPLRYAKHWQRPMDTWLERSSELGAKGEIAGLLDRRGWTIPRTAYLRMSAANQPQLRQLILKHPTLRMLVTDPFMTSVTIGPSVTSNHNRWLLAFFQEFDQTTTSKIELALYQDLDQLMRQKGLPSLRRAQRPKENDNQVGECRAVRQNLFAKLSSGTSSALWLRAELNLSNDGSTPSCQLHYEWHP